MIQPGQPVESNQLHPVLQGLVQTTVDMRMVANKFLIDLRCAYVLIKRIDAMAERLRSLFLSDAELDDFLTAYAQTMLDLNNTLPEIVGTQDHLHHLFITCDQMAEDVALSIKAGDFDNPTAAYSITAEALRKCEETHKELEESVGIIEAGFSRLARVVHHYEADISGSPSLGEDESASGENVAPIAEQFDADKFCQAVLTALMEEQALRDQSYEEIGH